MDTGTMAAAAGVIEDMAVTAEASAMEAVTEAVTVAVTEAVMAAVTEAVMEAVTVAVTGVVGAVDMAATMDAKISLIIHRPPPLNSVTQTNANYILLESKTQCKECKRHLSNILNCIVSRYQRGLP